MRYLTCLLVAGLALVARAKDDTAARTLVSRADLHYTGPVTRSEDGLPVGNGRTGSLVWTTPNALHFQINRVDVQPMGGATTSFFERNSDYMGGCGFVDIDVSGGHGNGFASGAGPESLSVFDGLATLEGHTLTARVLAWPTRDVLAVELDDRRSAPNPLQIDLRMLRYLTNSTGIDFETRVKAHAVAVRTRDHVATSRLQVVGDRIVLTQEFSEGGHFAGSAVAIAVVGTAAHALYANETTVRLITDAESAPRQRKTTVLIASAATLDPHADPSAEALAALDAAAARGFDTLRADTAAWWHAFWARGALELHSADGVADEVAANYHYYLYLMAATSRGDFPPKFNGMLWNTAGDLRAWGAQHWFANLSCYYEALFASNRLELLDPVFAMYTGMFEASATAARQQWGSRGIFIPETTWYDGLAPLPEDIAAEMRELYLMRKPWAERSERFKAFAETKNPHSSRWNWIGGGSWQSGHWMPTERGFGPFGPVTHNLATTAKVAYFYWERYEYTLDHTWLETRAYPMLKGAAELYQYFPNFGREADGLYHIRYTNSNESVLGTRDSDEDLSAMRGIFAAAIRAAEILGRDESERKQWSDILGHLAPLPTSADSDGLKPADYDGPTVFVRGRRPVVDSRGFLPDQNSLPQWFFDLCNADSPDGERLQVANATFDRSFRGAAIGEKTPVGVLSKLAVAGARLGRVEATRFLVPNQMRSLTAERAGVYRNGRPLMNRLALREGVQAFDAQRLGRAADALEIALLASAPAEPAGESVVRVFSAWPAEWDATFTLRARGGFVVTARRHAGNVDFVEVASEAGATLRLHNPWPNASVDVRRGDGSTEQRSGTVLRLATKPGERLRLTAAGTAPSSSSSSQPK